MTARMMKAVRSSSKLLIPQDAVVKGRIREFRQLADVPYSEVGVEFYEVDTPEHVSTFFADVVSLQQIAGVETSLSRGMRPTTTAGSMMTSSVTEKIRPIELPGVATFFLGRLQTIPKGFQMTWRTRKQRHPF